MRMERINYFGTGVDILDKQKLERHIDCILKEEKCHYIVFANVHILVMAKKQGEFKKAINNADIVSPDGMPLIWAARMKKFPEIYKCSGPDTMEQIIKSGLEKGYTHYFYGSKPETLVLLRKNLEAGFPGICIAGMESPPFRPMTAEEDLLAAERINKASPDFIWVGLGAPKQELWMMRNKEMINRGIMLGVGAAFDFIAGTVARAPVWMQKTGLEWFFRLIREPRRLYKRYFITNTLFVFYVITGFIFKEERFEDYMKNQITIDNISLESNRITYKYTVKGKWISLFRTAEEFYIEYGEDISMVPESVAVIPLVCNILPMAWIADATIIVDELDKEFYESIDNIRQGYKNMYPTIKFKGEILVNRIAEPGNRYIKAAGSTAAFFSGGADSFSTLIAHEKEKPVLLTVWGADITLDDISGWERVKLNATETGRQFGTGNIFIKSSFRRFLDEQNLDKLVDSFYGGWWYGFQHGIGLIGHAAPCVFARGLHTVYIASSLSCKERSRNTCASDISIDNFIRFCGCRTIHDGYELSRQDKIGSICRYVSQIGIKVVLRVCWISAGGGNCCRCEKCYRTIFEIMVEGKDPRDYGFVYSDTDIEYMINDIRDNIDFININHWLDIRERYAANMDLLKNDRHLKRLKDLDFVKLNTSVLRRFIRLLHTVKNNIKVKVSRRGNG